MTRIIPKLHFTRVQKLKIAVVFYVLATSAYGTMSAYHDAKAIVSAKLDGFAQTRVEAKGLVEGTTIVKEVPVIDPSAAAGLVSEAAKTGAMQGAGQGVKDAVSGKN